MNKKLSRRAHGSQSASADTRFSFKQTTISAAISFALVTACGQVVRAEDQPVADNRWRPNIELRAVAGSDDGYVRGQIAGLVPLFQNSSSLAYTDLRFLVANDSINEGNVGLGYRSFNSSHTWIFGAYGYYDRRNSENDEDYTQVTVGAEALNHRYELRANYYHPLTDENVVGVTNKGAFFQGNGLFTNGIYEEALESYDIEAGVLLPFKYETRVYAGYYGFEGEIVDHADGVRARVEFRPRKNITLGLTAQHDDLFDSQAFFNVGYSFGFRNEAGVRTLHERMVQLPHRDIDVVTYEIESETRNDALVRIGDIVHIDNTDETTGNLGTEEEPYINISECKDGGDGGILCEDASIIHVHGYDMEHDYMGYFVLNDGQRLLGTGVGLFDMPATFEPLVENDGYTVVTLADNNEVAGLTLDGGEGRIMNGDGGEGGYTTVAPLQVVLDGGEGEGLIYGHNVTGFNIHDNTIQYGHYSGIHLDYDGGELAAPPPNATGTINNNVIVGNGQYSMNTGIDIYTYLDDDSTTQDFTIADNIINNNSGAGIQVENEIYNDASLTQGLMITDNNFEANSAAGIRIDSGVMESTLISDLTITGNMIDADGAEGIFINTKADGGTEGGTYSLDDTMTVTGNTLTDPRKYAIVIKADGAESGAMAGNIVVSDNMITSADGGEGIKIERKAKLKNGETPVTLNDTVTVSDNNIVIDGFRNKAKPMIKVKEEGEGATMTSTITVTDNTITADGAEGIKVEVKDKLKDGTAPLTLTSNLTVSGNTLTSSGVKKPYAIKIKTETEDVNLGSTIDVSDNTINMIMADGGESIQIDIKGKGVDETIALANTLTVTGNTITTNGNGIRITDKAEGTATLTSTLDVSDNTLTFSDDSESKKSKSLTAIEIIADSSGSSDAKVDQTITSLSDNTIQGIQNPNDPNYISDELFDYGISLVADGADGSTTIQTVLSNGDNSITVHDTGYEIYANANGEGTTATQNVTSASDDITVDGGEYGAIGIYVDAYANNGGETDQTVSFTDAIVMVDSDYNREAIGIGVDAYANYGGVVQDVTLLETPDGGTIVTVDGGESTGIGVNAEAMSGVIDQTLTTSTIITVDGGEAVGLGVDAYTGYGGEIDQTIMSTGTTISVDGGEGIGIGFGAETDYGGDIFQTASFTDAMVTVDAQYDGIGVGVIADAEYGGMIGQEVTFLETPEGGTVITVDSEFAAGVEVGAYAGYGGDIDQTLTTSTIITVDGEEAAGVLVIAEADYGGEVDQTIMSTGTMISVDGGEGVGVGVGAYTNNGGDILQTATFTDATVTVDGGESVGVGVGAYAEYGGVIGQEVTLLETPEGGTMVTVDGGESIGVLVIAEADYGGDIDQTLTSGTIITVDGGESIGVYVEGYADNHADVNQFLTLNNTSISSDYGHAISIEADADGSWYFDGGEYVPNPDEASVVYQEIVLNGGLIGGEIGADDLPDGDALRLRAKSDDLSLAEQRVTIKGGVTLATDPDSGDDGIDLEAEADDGGTTTQGVTLEDDTIINVYDDGIRVRADEDDGGQTYQTVDLAAGATVDITVNNGQPVDEDGDGTVQDVDPAIDP